VWACITRWWQLRRRMKTSHRIAASEDGVQDTVEAQQEQGRLRRVECLIVHGINVFLTFLYVNAAWVFFRSTSIEQAITVFRRMFIGGIALPTEGIYDAFNLDEFWYVMKVLHLTDFTYSKYILMAVFTIVILAVTFFGKNVQELAKKWKMSLVSAVTLAVVFVWCIVSLSGVSTFLYFNF